MKKKITMTLDEIVFNDFKKYCYKNGMKISTKVEVMLKEVIKNDRLNNH